MNKRSIIRKIKIITREYLEAAKRELDNCEQGKDGECQMGQ